MSSSVNKYYDDLEDKEYWASKNQKQTRYKRFISFIYKLLNKI